MLTPGSATTRALFTATIFLGSFLLFLVQPLVARLVLPKLGGAPSVWNTAMLFFQAMLLAGYLYAHGVSRLAPRMQVWVHLALFGVAALTLPLGLRDWMPGAESDPAVWLLGLLLASIGPLFFVVSAQAPLMQAWYARTGDAPDPYFLYAASNAGSLLALFAYPLGVEPLLRLSTQLLIWSIGFVLLAGLVLLCGLRVPRDATAAVEADDAPAPSWGQRLRWTALAAVPSGLLISTTTHLTTDVMAMPLLWVIPLGLYLVTFIVAFAEGGSGFVRHAQRIAAPLMLVLGSYVFLAAGSVALLMAVAGLVLLFYVALALHGRLAALRPHPSRLTDFYLWVSVGGMLGGLFCAIVAPSVFDWAYEHPILLVTAALLLPAEPFIPRLMRLWTSKAVRWAVPIAALPLSLWAGERLLNAPSDALAAITLGVLALLAVAAIGRPAIFATLFAAVMLTLGGWNTIDTSTIPGARERSFFGIYAVRASAYRGTRELVHGTTLHGVQSLAPELADEPMTYYAPESGVGRAFAAAPELIGPGARMAFVGLGTGTLACYAEPGQRWTAFEIDPVIARIARDPRYFSYLQRCAPDIEIVMGDARLRLAERRDAFDMLAVDAFSSDAIPLHLLTAEAFDTYARALSAKGVLLVHISNRHLDLEPVVAAAAKRMGWQARRLGYRPAKDLPLSLQYSPSVWIALTRDAAGMERLKIETGGGERWTKLEERPGFEAWTDDYASVLPLLKY